MDYKIIREIHSLKVKYNKGMYTQEEYVQLLNELNSTVWSIDTFSLSDEISPSKIQEIIHNEIEIS